jgi:hypothetical protein
VQECRSVGAWRGKRGGVRGSRQGIDHRGCVLPPAAEASARGGASDALGFSRGVSLVVRARPFPCDQSRWSNDYHRRDVGQSLNQPGLTPDPGAGSATPLTARSLLAATAAVVERAQAAAIWIDNHRPDIRAFGRDVKQRGGPDDPWRYLFTKVSGNTALTMKAALELERRLTPTGVDAL